FSLLILLIVYVIKLLSKVSELEFYNEYLKERLGPALVSDFANVYAEQRNLAMSLWQYFYYILATKEVIAVDPDKFVTQGFEDLCEHEPLFRKIMEVEDKP